MYNIVRERRERASEREQEKEETSKQQILYDHELRIRQMTWIN